MKKIVFVAMLLLTIANSYTMDIFNMALDIELGLLPQGHLRMYQSSKDLYVNMSFYGDFNIECQMFDNRLFYGINTKMYIWKMKDNISFSPDAIDFMFFAGVRIIPEIEIFFRHYCKHPIIAWSQNVSIYPVWEQWYQEVGIKFHFVLFEDDK